MAEILQKPQYRCLVELYLIVDQGVHSESVTPSYFIPLEKMRILDLDYLAVRNFVSFQVGYLSH